MPWGDHRTHGIINHLLAGISVGPAETINRMRTLVDHLDVHHRPDPFVAVAAHDQNFPQVEDQQIFQLLRAAHKHLRDHMKGSLTR